MTDELLSTPDNSEVMRDAIASILKKGVDQQKALAVAAGVDPKPYDLRIFTERVNPWDEWNGASIDDDRPIVNVWYDGTSYNLAESDYIERQKSEARYNIDIVALGSSYDSGDGHTAADRDAAFTAHQTKRIIRGLIMSSERYLLGQEPGTIWRRWITSETSFQPDREGNSVRKVHGFRLVLDVHFNETAPQFAACTITGFDLSLVRADSGEVLTTLHIDPPIEE